MICWTGFLQPSKSTEPSKSKKEEKAFVKKVEKEVPRPEKTSTIEEETEESEESEKSEESDTQVLFLPVALHLWTCIEF